jgi:hypothetical protein
MQDVAFSHQTQAKEHLLGVSTNSLEIDSHITSKFLQDFTKIDTKVLEDHAQMSFVLEMSYQADHMLLIFGISFIQLLKDFDLLDSSFSPTSGQ